jgi:hypothetical protein
LILAGQALRNGLAYAICLRPGSLEFELVLATWLGTGAKAIGNESTVLVRAKLALRCNRFVLAAAATSESLAATVRGGSSLLALVLSCSAQSFAGAFTVRSRSASVAFILVPTALVPSKALVSERPADSLEETSSALHTVASLVLAEILEVLTSRANRIRLAAAIRSGGGSNGLVLRSGASG